MSQAAVGPVGAGLHPGAGWQYNKWLGRWRREAVESTAGAGSEDSTTPETVGDVPFDDSDQKLVERVKAGDVRAFEMLHRRYYGRIYRFAFLRLGNAEDAADVASTAFCNALRKLPSFEFRRSASIYPWLHQIASNLVVDVVRDQPPGGMLSLDAQAAEGVDSFLEYLPADGPSPQELVERSEVQDVVRQAINKLPADQARAVALRFLGDLSIREIAVSLDRSEGAIKSLIHRALQNMRQHLKTAVAGPLSGAVSTQGIRSERAQSSVSEVLHVHSTDA